MGLFQVNFRSVSGQFHLWLLGACFPTLEKGTGWTLQWTGKSSFGAEVGTKVPLLPH